MTVDPEVIAFGLGVGVLIGLTGIGGGSLMTPLLILFTGVTPVVAIGTDLAYGAITKTLGAWRHLRMGTVDIGVSLWLAVGSAPGALGGVVLVDRLRRRYGAGFDDALLIGVGCALVIVGLTVLVRAVLGRNVAARERRTVELSRRLRVQAVAIGLVLGLLVGATSVGSGALIGLALIVLFRLTPRRVVGTDVFHAAILLWVAGLAHWVTGNVDIPLMLNILAGSLPGVVLGAALTDRMPETALRPALGCVLLASAMAVLRRAGLDVALTAVFAVPAVAGAFAWLVHRRRTPDTAPPPRAAEA